MMSRRKFLGVGVATLASVATGVAGASFVSPDGRDTLGGPDSLQPDGGSVSLAGAVSDPARGPSWTVRVYRSKTGQACAEAGRLDGDGNFGVLDENDRFEILPVAASGTCAALDDEPFSLAVNTYPATAKRGSRSVIFGVTSSSISSVTLLDPRRDSQTRPGSGAFLFVTDEPTTAGASIRFDTDASSSRTVALGPVARP